MDPYKSGLFKESPYHSKTDVEGRLAVILQCVVDNRGLNLISPMSRCVKKYEIHELIASCEEGIKPGGSCNKAAYLGFVEIERGGVILSGDELYCDGVLLGRIAGFDETHMPNHINIVVSSEKYLTGLDLGLKLDGKIVFKHIKD